MILKPTKHSHPDQSVINVSLLLLKRLKANRVDQYETLRAYAKGAVIGGDVLFLPALNFLYMIGLIEYRPKIDAIEYLGHNETL